MNWLKTKLCWDEDQWKRTTWAAPDRLFVNLSGWDLWHATSDDSRPLPPACAAPVTESYLCSSVKHVLPFFNARGDWNSAAFTWLCLNHVARPDDVHDSLIRSAILVPFMCESLEPFLTAVQEHECFVTCCVALCSLLYLCVAASCVPPGTICASQRDVLICFYLVISLDAVLSFFACLGLRTSHWPRSQHLFGFAATLVLPPYFGLNFHVFSVLMCICFNSLKCS